MKITVTCRHGVKYSILARGNYAESKRLQKMLTECCCYVCHNRHCEIPIEGNQDCKNECELYGKVFCKTREEQK